MKLAEDRLKELAEALDKGHSQVLNDYLTSLARFHKYSFRNLMLITEQCPDATHVAGFHAWKALGRSVKKGESGIAILAPIVYRSSNGSEAEPSSVNDHQGLSNDDQDHNGPAGFRVVYVFDICQTEGRDFSPVSPVRGASIEMVNLLEAVCQRLGITIEERAMPWGFGGASQGGHIVLNAGLIISERFSALAHELAHELLHSKQQRSEQKLSRQQMEIEAEAVAYVVCLAHGVDSCDQSRDYIHLYRGDSNMLMQSMGRIQHTATTILVLMQELESQSAKHELANERQELTHLSRHLAC